MSDTLVRMPKLADTLVEGTLGQWLRQVGETVQPGQPLASIETDKVTTELTSPAAGTLLEILVAEGQTVPIETVIARIGASLPDDKRADTLTPSEAPSAAEPEPSAPRPTPVAARLIAEHNLAVGEVKTRARRITREDVLRHLAQKTPEPQPVQRPAGYGRTGEVVPLTSMRRAIAEHMTRARQSIPHGQTVLDADLTRLVAWREERKTAFADAEGASLTFTVLFVHALARAAGVGNVGVAVALEAGLIVPVLKRADVLTLGEIARGIADLAARARANKLAADDTQGAHMTVTNVGSFGNLTAAPIVPLGQVAILGPGVVERRPLPGPDGGIRPGWRCLLSLMFDRRALDDFAADRLLRGVVQRLARIPEAA
jgi:2-oxoglutarate dehydrogenase E2 component (dihydrolipoamide succinyltransferase)